MFARDLDDDAQIDVLLAHFDQPRAGSKLVFEPGMIIAAECKIPREFRDEFSPGILRAGGKQQRRTCSGGQQGARTRNLLQISVQIGGDAIAHGICEGTPCEWGFCP